ncbi:drug/metabolite transporter (DMT)-like permease [Anoxybacillus voinovskiensis]|uniref:Drug/metabolite transporter (DMT)-like permease n=1 Tax=Anoxybacteroides voinovskiense TaxID=230470 RepID=A0A840DUV7_9BACL|nr:DMT family transporter [Anoxybacillus voinovskiensis]MBB4075463.1 drug/metabolite transporter (DMT)-like permease [Anoxybacillus voinovskiensis]GGJ79503.1 membrane protein [Anoxybacillus voinovskiensis]
MNNIKTYFLLFLTTTIWGGAFVAGKIATVSLHPISVAFFRFFGASLILFPLWRWKERHAPVPTKKDWGLLALLGLTGVFLYNVCFFIATKYAPIVKSSLVIAVNAPLITLFAALFLKEKITAKNIVGLVVALFGAVYIITNGHPSVLLELGVAPIDLVLIGACLSWSTYSVVGKVVMKKYSPLAATTYATGFGTLFLAPFALYYTTFASVKASGWEVWVSVLYVAVIVSVISFVWWYNGIQKVGASTSSIFINVMPISAAVMGTIFFNEQLTHVHIVGALFVFGGILFNMYNKQQKKETPSKENITA